MVASYEHFWHSSAPGSSGIFYRGSGHSGQGPPEQDPAGSPAFSLLATAELYWHGAHNRKSTLKRVFRILAGRDIVRPDTSKQPQTCVHGRKRQKEKETLLQWKSLLFADCWHFLFREAAGYLWKTELKEDFYVLREKPFLQIDMLRGKADAAHVIRSQHGLSVLVRDLRLS